MKLTITTFFSLLFFFGSYSQTVTTNQSSIVFQELLNKTAETASGISMTVIAPQRGIKWSGAAGFDSKEKDQKLTANQPFRIASITKTYTAVAILRLAEMGKLDIDASIEGYISEAHKEILAQDNYDLSAITITHCLQHTSGIFDYAVGNDDYVMTAIQDPSKRWTRTEQIQFAVDHGNPVAAPGEKYHYSDTGYILLGEIIELKTKKGLAEGYRALIDFERLDLASTYLESLEPSPHGLPRKVRAYLDTTDATNWDNSVDLYGGGGYVSTTEDMAKFYHALFNNQVFENPETLEIMLSKNGITNQGNEAAAYRMGLWEVRTPVGSGFMHNGFWDSAVIHFPEQNATIAVNYVDKYSRDAMRGALKEIVKSSN